MHPAPASQQGAPTTPHAPPLQPPAEQLPCPLPQEFPCATQEPETQQAPVLHSTPSQQGWPAPPHAPHCPLGPQVWPLCVQKSAESPVPPSGTPGQQGPLAPPQEAHASLLKQLPREPPHAEPDPTQVAPTQQWRMLQVELAQHGCPVPPHGTMRPA